MKAGGNGDGRAELCFESARQGYAGQATCSKVRSQSIAWITIIIDMLFTQTGDSPDLASKDKVIGVYLDKLPYDNEVTYTGPVIEYKQPGQGGSGSSPSNTPSGSANSPSPSPQSPSPSPQSPSGGNNHPSYTPATPSPSGGDNQYTKSNTPSGSPTKTPSPSPSKGSGDQQNTPEETPKSGTGSGNNNHSAPSSTLLGGGSGNNHEQGSCSTYTTPVVITMTVTRNHMAKVKRTSIETGRPPMIERGYIKNSWSGHDAWDME